MPREVRALFLTKGFLYGKITSVYYVENKYVKIYMTILRGRDMEKRNTPKKKKKQTREQFDQEQERIIAANPAKSMSSGKYHRGRRHSKKNKNNHGIARKVGYVLVGIQLLATLVFIVSLVMLNMLPVKYLAVIIALLAVILLAVFLSQKLAKKRGIIGKIISIIMSVVLAFGSFYIFRTNSTVAEVSGGDKKLNQIVVAVRADDAAETIQDAKDYTFGVQYAMGGDEITDTVDAINDELGTSIATVEYQNIREQFVALDNGEVDAIVYNEAYADIIIDAAAQSLDVESEVSEIAGEEVVEGTETAGEVAEDSASVATEEINTDVKIIYTRDVELQVENRAENVDVNESFIVYISGIDVYGKIETTSRSDVNILAVVNPTSHQILLVTTPRDYYVEIPYISGGQKDKLTHAGVYGVDASMNTLDALYDINIDFYARVNFTSLVQMVDALGGVDVNSEVAFTTSSDSGLEMNVVQGMNHFNGEQALAFSRERQNLDGGDNQRGKNQQAVITAMIKKAVSPAILTGANGILNSVSGNVDTNMSQEQIQELIKTQLGEGGSWSIKSMAATGTGDSQVCYSCPGTPLYVMQPDMEVVQSIRDTIKAVESGEVLEDSESTN